MVAAKSRINGLHRAPASRFNKRRTAPAITHSAPYSDPVPLPISVSLALAFFLPPATTARRQPKHRSLAALSGAVLLVVQPKRLKPFSKAESQLLTYLAILRQLRRHTRKPNTVVQGSYPNGPQYEFAGITNDGELLTSRTYDIRDEADVKTAFDFIATIIVTRSWSPLVELRRLKTARAACKMFHREVCDAEKPGGFGDPGRE